MKKIQDSIAEVTEKISNIRYTEDSGFNFCASTSIYSYNVQGGTVEDTLGNTGVLYSYAGGVSTGSPSVSFTCFYSVTNAPDIYKLEGEGAQIGGH